MFTQKFSMKKNKMILPLIFGLAAVFFYILHVSFLSTTNNPALLSDTDLRWLYIYLCYACIGASLISFAIMVVKKNSINKKKRNNLEVR